jgi:hypothetical protein
MLWPKEIKPHHLLVHGKHYFWMTDPSDEKKCVIAEVDFPPDDLVTLMNEERATKHPVPFLLLADGYGR